MMLTRLHTNKYVTVSGAGQDRYDDEKSDFIRRESRDDHNDFSETDGFRGEQQEEHTLVYNSPDGRLPWYANSRLLCALDFIFCGWVQRHVLTHESYEVEYDMTKDIVG